MTTPTARIAPCLWFDDQAEAAAALYCDVLPATTITAVSRYPAGFDNPADKPRGSVMTVELDVAGTPFTALNGGPPFRPDPSISFFLHTKTAADTERIATALGDGGSYLMELDSYPWSDRYAWVQDRYGFSWQVMMAANWDGPTIAPCLMFTGAVHGQAEAALRHYAGIFPDGRVELIERYLADEGPAGTVKHGRASLTGQPLVAMDSHLGQGLGFSEAISLQVLCHDQDEVDHYWTRLSDHGQESVCGWLKDRFGVSWQVTPTVFRELLEAGEGGGPGYERAFHAMLAMTKLDIAALQAAYRGGP